MIDKEQESGLYVPPPPPRIAFEGTLDDAQDFFQQTTPVANCRNCPIAKYTDGLPIIIPTEEKVIEMLTGTSHSPEEEVAYQLDMRATSRLAGSLVTYARGYKTNVEKVATVAVMAGCKPEYMPVCLAIATAGGGSTNCPGTSSALNPYFVVSGPIAKEIGMNAGQASLDFGNPANVTLGRAAVLMTVSFGNCIIGAIRSDAGNPLHGKCFAEDAEGLPPGWEGLNEECYYYQNGERVYYTANESVLGKGSTNTMTVQEYAPSSFRGLIGEGYGGMARRIGVEGTPGPHNFLEYVLPLYIPSFANNPWGSKTLLMHPNMAMSLYDYGFMKKAEVYEWMYESFHITAAEHRNYGWYDFMTASGDRTEATSGMKYKDLPDDYLLPVFGTSSGSGNCIIVGNGFADELCWGWNGRPSGYPIDPWK
ncbi:hypothetical protein ACFLTL_02630 [Chloroflexota bacterium]